MSKYFQIFKISYSQEFAYRLNFVMWRLRNVFQIFLIFFLWDSVFSDPDRVLFGYDRARILTYVFGILIVRAFVLSAKTHEVAGEISRGDLSNYLIKTVSYFRYWLARDLSSKALNLIFASVEAVALYLILKPPFFLQTDPIFLITFLVSVLLAMTIYFLIVFLTSFIPFWVPEAAWGAHFLVSFVFVEFLSGSFFPIDILPSAVQNVINVTPFPYLIYFPLQVYLGQVQGERMVWGLAISLVWAIALFIITKRVWLKGLKVYQSHGR